MALANHLVMGPAILARALGGAVPYAVKVHGSALEYTVRPQRERFLPYAAEGLAGAAAVLVGSRHTAESLWEVMADPALPARTRLGPPGVDVHEFRPAPAEAADGWRRSPTRSRGARRPGAASPARPQALRGLDPARDRIVSYVGKLIVSKGVDLLLAAWPLVVAEVPDARLVHRGIRHLPRGAGSDGRRARARRPRSPARDRRRGPGPRGRPRAGSSPTSRPSSTALEGAALERLPRSRRGRPPAG